MVQDKGAALLIDGHAELVARAGADGAHLTGIAAFSEALERLKPERIAGVGGLASRHDAMVAAERGADYVMFGEPDASGERPGFRARSRSASPGGRKCSRPRASAMPPRPMRSRRWSKPAPISSRSAICSGATPQWRRKSPPPRATCACRRPRHEPRARHDVALAALVACAAPALAQPRRRPRRRNRAAPAAAETDNGNADLAYGAFQRGIYLTALAEATKRAQQNDPAAMTLLGELYANGLGVGRDDSKAAQWYKLAAAHGDRNAMFALAMFDFEGRAGPRNPDEAAAPLDAAAKLGHPAAAYDLGLLYLQGQQFPQDFKRAAELFRQAADAGNPEAQYALATMYKEGRGVPKDHARGDAADGPGGGRRQSRRHGRIRHRPVQRQRHGQGRDRRRPAVPQGGAARQRRSRRTAWRAS